MWQSAWRRGHDELMSAFALCSLLSALCSLPYALCPLPYALCSLLSALCPMLSALCSLPRLRTPDGFIQIVHEHQEPGKKKDAAGGPHVPERKIRREGLDEIRIHQAVVLVHGLPHCALPDTRDPHGRRIDELADEHQPKMQGRKFHAGILFVVVPGD